MHDNVDDLIESALNSKLLLINSQRLNKEKQEAKNVVEQPTECGNRIVKSLQNFRVIHKNSISLNNTSQFSLVHAVAPILSTREPEYSPSMGYEHPNTTPKTESDEIIKSGVEELVPILSENEVTLEDKRECDVPISENSPICDDHSEIFSDSKNDDDISSEDNDFEDIKYVEASLSDPEIVSVEEENVVQQEEEEFNLEEIQDVILREKLLSINRIIANIESLNDNPTPDRVLNSFISIPIFEESDNSLLDNFLPEFETFSDHTKETRSGNTTTHGDDSLPEYDSFCFEIEPDQEREPEYSPSMGYEHPNTTPKTESDEIIKSGVEELVPILSENEVTLEDKRECDVPISENSPICDDHSEIFSDSKNDDDISSEDNDFEDIKYVEASLSDPEIVSVEEENVVQQEEEEFNLEEIQDVILREKLLSINRIIANIESLNDNPTPDQTRSGNTTHVDNSLPEYDSFCFEIEPDQERLINVVKNNISDDSTSDPLLEEADLFLFDNLIPLGIENFADDSEGDVCFLEELLIDDFIPFPNNETSESDFNNPSIPRPPLEPPDAEYDLEPDAGEEIPVVMNDKDEFDDDYSSFMFVIFSKMFLSFLSAESEDTIFYPDISV
uniref:Reverse transcriptase domain-containing protein n=1 Tax=Tanacetum cinerariifolium TaxID=118510 RepID=A0A699IAW1_TANCI|nr:hypothetical protein [Tanacetum cinerariifolium]